MIISIVTLSFNQRDYLRQAIDSVLHQEYSELDYIIVDPGSSDGSRELIESYKSGIVQLIFEPDEGPADGLNKGFAQARGQVFGFLNADDLLMPGSLQRVADYFRQNPDCDLAFGNGFVVDSDGKEIRHVKARNFTVRRYCYGGTRFLQQSTFFRREAFNCSPRFNLANRTCWDGELFVNMASKGVAVGYIDADLAKFRIHSASISGSGRLLRAYREDCRRIHRELRGRDWRPGDELWRLAYRSEGILIGLKSWLFDKTRSNDL